MIFTRPCGKINELVVKYIIFEVAFYTTLSTKEGAFRTNRPTHVNIKEIIDNYIYTMKTLTTQKSIVWSELKYV